MSQVRRALKVGVLGVLGVVAAGCGPGESISNAGCGQRGFVSRSDSCFVYSRKPLRLVAPLPDVEDLCRHTCIETTVPVQVGGYASLTEVPVLGRIRKAKDLTIETDGLRDLDGLQNLEEVGLLTVRSTNQSADQFRSLVGLSVKKINSLYLGPLNAISTLDGLPSGLEFNLVSVRESSFETLDASSARITGEGIVVTSLPNLKTLEGLPSISTVKILDVSSNKKLARMIHQGAADVVLV